MCYLLKEIRRSNFISMYYKGMKSNGMVERLNIDKILQHIYTELEPLYRELGVYGEEKKKGDRYEFK